MVKAICEGCTADKEILKGRERGGGSRIFRRTESKDKDGELDDDCFYVYLYIYVHIAVVCGHFTHF